jgi:glycosyltransferase involved in cell wall biosynthesis
VRILHLNNENVWRGGQRQTLMLAGGLRDTGAVSVVGCPPGSPLEQRSRAEALETVPIPCRFLGATLAVGRLAGDFDLIHCHNARALRLAALTAGLHRTPFLATQRVAFSPTIGWLRRYSIRRAAGVVCVSRFLAGQLTGLGLPSERLTVIPSALPPPEADLLMPQYRASVRARLGVSPETALIGNIAELVRSQDHATLLHATRRLAGRHSALRLVIFGDGPLRGKLRSLRRKLGLEERVLLPGYEPEAERCLPAFDLYATSARSEGLGGTVLEAFAAGVPVVAVAGGGLPELVRPGQTGLLTPVGDAPALSEALHCLLANPPLAQELSTRARKLVQTEFTVARLLEQYQRLYEKLMGR